MKSIFLLLLLIPVLELSAADLPAAFDLRDVNKKIFVTPVKAASARTGWAFAAIASMESNLEMTGAWKKAKEAAVATLAEYHMDWWNGFNSAHNADIAPQTGGLTVHYGADYRVAAAFLSRGGAIRKIDGNSYKTPPAETSPDYHYFYARDIEWIAKGSTNLQTDIKNAIIQNGAIGSAITWDGAFYSPTLHSLYQPLSSTANPNHAIAIVGWDDNKVTQSSNHGAWLAKNGWGTAFGEGGYFWISYDDKIAGHDLELGAVSFLNVEPLQYSQIYSHDYHGWRDTNATAKEAFNAFTANKTETLKAVSFYTAARNVTYTIKIYNRFTLGRLLGLLSTVSGTASNVGFHTVDLNTPVSLSNGGNFYVYVNLSAGGHAYDKTSDVPVLIGREETPEAGDEFERTTVESRANSGESYYRLNNSWVDLNHDDATANFCIKALTTTKNKS